MTTSRSRSAWRRSSLGCAACCAGPGWRAQAPGTELTVADLTMDEDAREVRRDGEPIELTATEFELLRFMMRNPSARSVEGADPRSRMELRLRRPGPRRRAVHQLPAQEDRLRARAPDPHGARRRVRVEATGLIVTPYAPARLAGPSPAVAGSADAAWPVVSAGLLALLALACATVGVVTYAHLRTVLISGLNAQLSSANQRYVDCLQAPPPGSQDGDHVGHQGGRRRAAQVRGRALSSRAPNTLNAVFASGGTPWPRTWRTPTSATSPPPIRRCSPALPQASLTSSGQLYGPRSVELSAYGDYQVVARSTEDGLVVTGMPLTSVTNTLREVALAEIAVFSVALVLTGIIGLAGSGLATAAAAGRSHGDQSDQLPLSIGEVSLPSASGRQPGYRGRPGRRGLQPDARPRRSRARPPGGERVASAHLRRRRQPRAPHPAHCHPRLRRAGAPASRPLPPDVEHALGRVQSESARMSELVDELLLLARLDAAGHWRASLSI